MKTIHAIEDEALANVDNWQMLDRQLEKLPNDYQRVVVILYCLGLPQGKIAEVFHCTPQGISQVCQKAMKRFLGLMPPAQVRNGRTRGRVVAACGNCGEQKRMEARGLCAACYTYETRTGRPRPKRIIERGARRG